MSMILILSSLKQHATGAKESVKMKRLTWYALLILLYIVYASIAELLRKQVYELQIYGLNKSSTVLII